ncbi:MAG: hypothetical protein ACM3S0_16845, partial [Acidobacteriota bacterium]
QVVTALIAAFASLTVAVITQIVAIRNQRALAQNQQLLAQLQSDLAEKKAERDARRDYEYEARKRLYEEADLYSHPGEKACRFDGTAVPVGRHPRGRAPAL